jgi:hypothetical protein
MAADSRAINYKLKASQLAAAKPKDKNYLLLDGGGLYVEVLTTGTKIWRYIYSIGGRRPKLTIGPFPEISITQARDVHALMAVPWGWVMPSWMPCLNWRPHCDESRFLHRPKAPFQPPHCLVAAGRIQPLRAGAGH